MPQINLAERIFFCEFCRHFSSRFYIVFAFDYHRDNLCDFVHIFFVHTPGCYCRSSQSHAACDKRRTGIIWYGIFIAETPTFEYFEVFSREVGTIPSRELYKFFDRDNNTLVLRPDITPSIARCVAKYYADEELPVRLCYTGNTYTNTLKLQGKLKEVTQIGAELINDDSSAADAEIIATVIDCFNEIGIKDFQIEIGQIDYFKGLVAESGISEDEEEQIKEYIHIKNFFGLEEYVDALDISDSLKKAFASFNSLFGGVSMLDTNIYFANCFAK